MLSLRTVARSAPRAATRLTRSAIRCPNQLNTLRAALPQCTRAFSSAPLRCAKQGEVDEELIAKFDSELAMEQEIRDQDEVPTSVKDYLENGPWAISDVEGVEDVVLTRKFGGET